jgi:superfamily II DNA or RNA helicase
MAYIIINNVYCQIIELTDIDIIDKLDRKLSYHVAGYLYTLAYKQGRWDGRTKLLTNQLKFQTGLLPMVENILQKSNVQYELKDERENVIFGPEIKLNPNYFKPRDYQIAAVNACLDKKCGMIKVSTGGGKSLILSMLIAKMNVKTVIYVISLDLLYQTKKMIEEALVGIEVGIVGDGKCVIKKITIATPYTVALAFDKTYDPLDDEDAITNEKLDQLSKIKIQKMVEGAKLFVIDEVQALAASSFQLIAKNSKSARYRIGASGTPYRDDGASLALTASTGEQLIDIDATQLIECGVLVPPKIYFFSVPELNTIDKHIKFTYQKVYEEYIVENEIRNNMIIEAAVKLHKAGRKILILAKRVKHGHKLLEMMPKNIPTYMLNGSSSVEERESVKNLFNIDKIDIIIASTIFDVGIDLAKLDALILAGSGSSSIRSLQRIGRVIRNFPGKKDAIVVDFIDNAPFVLNHSKKRFNTYKTEIAFQIKMPSDIIW